jgi:hypothetical protein
MLRAAIMEANRTSGAGATINIPAGIYTLTIPADVDDLEDKGDLDIITPTVGYPIINLIGAGAATTIVDANQLSRVFEIAAGRGVTMSGLTVRNGYGVEFGGGIFNRGSLTLTMSIVTGNQTVRAGGGIENFGFLSIERSTISANHSRFGRGIGSSDTAFVPLISQSTINGNDANQNGGGILTSSSTYIKNSTLTNNKAGDYGGALDEAAASTYLYNTTVTGNDADADLDTTGGGAGAYVSPGASLTIRNTLLVRNFLHLPLRLDDCDGTVYLYASNALTGGVNCSVVIVTGTNLASFPASSLGPLQNNGGPTWTMAPTPDSAALDAGVHCQDENAALLTTDQRGVRRPLGVECDLGAVEFMPPVLRLPLIVR